MIGGRRERGNWKEEGKESMDKMKEGGRRKNGEMALEWISRRPQQPAQEGWQL